MCRTRPSSVLKFAEVFAQSSYARAPRTRTGSSLEGQSPWLYVSSSTCFWYGDCLLQWSITGDIPIGSGLERSRTTIVPIC